MLFRNLFAAAFFLAIPLAAQAAPMTIWVETEKVYQNTTNNPCVFAGNGQNGCGQAPDSWPDPATDTQGNFTTLTRNYAGEDYTNFTASIPGAFLIALDVNDTSTAQQLTTLTLDFFSAANAVLLSYVFSPVTAVPSTANGTGWADYILAVGCSGTVTVNPGIDSCSAYSPFVPPDGTARIQFSFGYGTTGNDGADKVFLIPDAASVPVPEPGSLALLGAGLAGVASAARRRLRRSKP